MKIETETSITIIDNAEIHWDLQRGVLTVTVGNNKFVASEFYHQKVGNPKSMVESRLAEIKRDILG
jgi:hypothetical protein